MSNTPGPNQLPYSDELAKIMERHTDGSDDLMKKEEVYDLAKGLLCQMLYMNQIITPHEYEDYIRQNDVFLLPKEKFKRKEKANAAT